MVTVAITGVGGLLGRHLVAALEGTDVQRVVGLDIREPEGLDASTLVFRAADVRDVGFDRHLDGVDVLVHLAFQLDPLHDERSMRSINVDGTRNVFEAALRAGVPKVVYASSATVYGAHPDNDFPLTEASPLRANPGLPYAEHKLANERWLADFVPAHPELTVTILRPAIVAGHGVDNFITRTMFESPRPFLVRGHKPPVQFVHVDDVVEAFVHAILEDLPGAFNVGAEGWLSMDEVLAVTGRKPVEIPEEVAFATTERMWSLGLAETPPGVCHYLMHPWVVSPDALIGTGWKPRHTNRDALAAVVEDHRDWLVLGPVRTRRSIVRRGIAIAGLVAAVDIGRRLMRRRRAA